MTISETIRNHLEHRPFSEPITATGRLELGLGIRTAIDQTLLRLCPEGFIARIARGVYAKPRDTRFGGRILPDANEIATAFAKLRGQKLEIHGAEAVHRFGLTTQMPATMTYLVDRPARTLHLGNLKVHIKHAPAKMFLLAGRLGYRQDWIPVAKSRFRPRSSLQMEAHRSRFPSESKPIISVTRLARVSSRLALSIQRM